MNLQSTAYDCNDGFCNFNKLILSLYPLMSLCSCAEQPDPAFLTMVQILIPRPTLQLTPSSLHLVQMVAIPFRTTPAPCRANPPFAVSSDSSAANSFPASMEVVVIILPIRQ